MLAIQLSIEDSSAQIQQSWSKIRLAALTRCSISLREQGKYADELKVLENIRENYSEYCNAYRFDVDKYIGRAKYQAENAK